MASQEKYDKMMKMLAFNLSNSEGILEHGEKEDVELEYEKICESIRKMEIEREEVMNAMLDEEMTLEEVQDWGKSQTNELKPARDMRKKAKDRLRCIAEEELKMEREKEIQYQRKLTEEMVLQQQKLEEEWLKRKLEIEIEHGKKREDGESSKPQAVKLQKYTITPFTGEYKDWLRFWNQFTVEVDGSRISEISKFNYLMELVKGKPRDDILGLLHTVEGYNEAKRILEETYGKDVKVHKALIKELESLPYVSNILKLRDIHEFYNQFSRVVRTLVTMKKLESAESYSYTLMDKLGPMREVITQKDDEWENWGLEEIAENLRKFVERNPMQVNEDRVMYYCCIFSLFYVVRCVNLPLMLYVKIACLCKVLLCQ